tara:strand:- start:1347 stop:1736 length:390 start_codon:yes stop_codon:yes gene_type:complete
MNYLSSHKKKMSIGVPFAPKKILPGTVVSCKYTNRHGESKAYVVLCINSDYQGRFHCYDLGGYVSVDYMVKLGIINGPINYKGANANHLESTPQTIYEGLRSVSKRGYKQFEHAKISNAQIHLYNYERK